MKGSLKWPLILAAVLVVSRTLEQAGAPAALARAMVIPTHWLAYMYQWPQPRFSIDQGGNVGPDA